MMCRHFNLYLRVRCFNNSIFFFYIFGFQLVILEVGLIEICGTGPGFLETFQIFFYSTANFYESHENQFCLVNIIIFKNLSSLIFFVYLKAVFSLNILGTS